MIGIWIMLLLSYQKNDFCLILINENFLLFYYHDCKFTKWNLNNGFFPILYIQGINIAEKNCSYIYIYIYSFLSIEMYSLAIEEY
jgi:hypothetical protein